MEAHLLRTLSDCGEPVTAQPPARDPLLQEQPWHILVNHAAASVDQLRVSSPESDASKDGKYCSTRTADSRRLTRTYKLYKCSQYDFNTFLSPSLSSQKAQGKVV